MIIMLARCIDRLHGERKQQFIEAVRSMLNTKSEIVVKNECNGACSCKTSAEV